MAPGIRGWAAAIKPSDAVLALVLFLLVSRYGMAGWAVALSSAVVFAALTLAGRRMYGYMRKVVAFPYVRLACVVVAVFIAIDGVLAVYMVAYREIGEFVNDLAFYLAGAAAAWMGILVERPVEDEEESGDSVAGPVFLEDGYADGEPVFPRAGVAGGENFVDNTVMTGESGNGEEEATGLVTGGTGTVDDPVNADPGVRADMSPPPSKEPGRITVRKGSSLHIIEPGDVLYVAAMGDYVSIVTPDGRYVKEGTMARYGEWLGDGFVRIHRSTIVNLAKISSVELYGKQSYSVRLSNGESLKTSASGYRALRERLAR